MDGDGPGLIIESMGEIQLHRGEFRRNNRATIFSCVSLINRRETGYGGSWLIEEDDGGGRSEGGERYERSSNLKAINALTSFLVTSGNWTTVNSASLCNLLSSTLTMRSFFHFFFSISVEELYYLGSSSTHLFFANVTNDALLGLSDTLRRRVINHRLNTNLLFSFGDIKGIFCLNFPTRQT